MHKDKAEGSQGRDEVERLKDATFIRKTDLEAKILEQQLTPSFRRLETLKTLTGASGLIIALVTVIGGFLSVGNWFIGQQKDRQIRSEERLDRALTMLAEKDASRRLAAVTSLGSFLRERNDTQAPVRNAIISTIEDLDPQVLAQPVLDKGLRSLVQVNRGLVKEGDVWRSRPYNLNGLEQALPLGARLQTTAWAINLMLRKGAHTKDMAGVYLGKSDLSRLDLSGVNFDEAILAWADFRNSSLRGASFDGADLENTRFASSDLREAKFVLSNKQNFAVTFEDYVARDMARSDQWASVEEPDFSCADLRNADFAGHSIFGIAASDFPIGFNVSGPNFGNANLAGTDFTKTQVFTIAFKTDTRQPFEGVPEASGFLSSTGTFQYSFYRLTPNSSLGKDHMAFAARLNAISTGFAGSNWRDAKLPKALRDWLEKSPPEKAGSTLYRDTCQPRAPGQ